MLLLPRQKSTPGLANVLYITFLAWNRVNNACFFLINNFIFYLRYHISKPSRWFLHNFQTMLLQNTFNLLAGALNIGNHYIPLALLSVRRFRIQFFVPFFLQNLFTPFLYKLFRVAICTKAVQICLISSLRPCWVDGMRMALVHNVSTTAALC